MTELSNAATRPNRNARRYAIAGVLAGLAFPIAATLADLASDQLTFTFTNVMRLHTQPLMLMIDTAPIILGLLAAFAGTRQDALEAGSRQLQQQARELTERQQELEQGIADRAAELEERDRQLRIAAEGSRSLPQIRDINELAVTAVGLLARSLNGYFVDLFLLDERRTEAVRVASSEGPDLAAEVVAMGDPSLVGQVAASGEIGRMHSGPTGPQLALPLQLRGSSLGVLRFRAQSFTAELPDDTNMLQLLADQLSTAIETSRLFNESQQALKQLQALSGETVKSAYGSAEDSSGSAFEFTPAGVRPAAPGAATEAPGSLRVPLRLRGQTIGSIALTRGGRQGWTESDRDLAQKTASQVALALENVRLLEETRERAQQEQILSEFSARLGQTVDLETLLQTAVRELAAMPAVAGAAVYLKPITSIPEESPS